MSDLSAIARHVGLSLKLNGRNRMALIYGYLFPLIFLLAFWALYRHDRVPLVLHMGELLTVTILGGACFGMPTTMVSERERGVWRRYRTTPAPVWAFIASTLASRYLLLISAALIQIALAMAIGMPAPAHPLGLFVAFTVACVAFLGLGMVIAMLADNVPAVQALGQCIFLPMLIIGGVAVRLSSLPDWALHVSAFFPGRYAVKALQDSVTRGGLTDSGFELLALLLIGAAGGLAAAMMFRWDVKQKLAPSRGKAWLLLALSMWALVGLMAQAQGRVAAGPEVKDTQDVGTAADYVARPAAIAAHVEPAAPAPKAEPTRAPAKIDPPPPEPASWRTVTPGDFKRVAFERLPPDSGVISPVASTSEEIDPAVVDQIDKVSAALETWAPGQVTDPVQRARNLLYVAAVPDVLQMEGVERVLPMVVLERLKATTPTADLPKILYWVAMHPGDGDDDAASQLDEIGLPLVKGSTKEARGRVMIYAFKLLGRLTGDIPS